MIVTLLFGTIKRAFFRFILTILALILFGFSAERFLFDTDGMLYCKIEETVLSLVDYFSFLDKLNYENSVITLELFFIIFFFSIICIFLYNRLLNKKRRRQVISKIYNIFAYLLISIICSSIYLLYFETGLKDKIKLDITILFFIIFAIPVIFSISQFKASGLKTDIRLIKYNIDKINKDIQADRTKITELNKKIQ